LLNFLIANQQIGKLRGLRINHLCLRVVTQPRFSALSFDISRPFGHRLDISRVVANGRTHFRDDSDFSKHRHLRDFPGRQSSKPSGLAA
jgi:hypothetical protein